MGQRGIAKYMSYPYRGKNGFLGGGYTASRWIDSEKILYPSCHTL